MIKLPGALLVTLAGLMLGAAPAAAERTEVTVRVIAKAAKFIGSSMGGAEIVIRDADTGELLAKGTTRGTTGNTERIMTRPTRRGEPLSTPDAASFTATLDLSEPRLVEITAIGPRAQRQAMARASVTQWLVPGKHVTGGDGVLIELPGFVVDVLSPAAHTIMKRTSRVRIDANVAMMCGCPITPGGVWDAGTLTVSARVERDGAAVGDVPLAYAGKPSQFTATIDTARKGTYRVLVHAHDPATGNTGVDTTTFIVE